MSDAPFLRKLPMAAAGLGMMTMAMANTHNMLGNVFDASLTSLAQTAKGMPEAKSLAKLVQNNNDVFSATHKDGDPTPTTPTARFGKSMRGQATPRPV